MREINNNNKRSHKLLLCFLLVTWNFASFFEEERIMQHFHVKSNLLDPGSETAKFGFGFGGNNEQPLCPKPRRLGPAIPEFLKPLRCSKHSQPYTNGRGGVLNMIADKTIDGRESASTGCSPFCYAGSPPGRTGNPLVHDVSFIHQMELLSPFTRTKLPDKFGIVSASPV